MAVHRFDPETGRDVTGQVRGEDLDIASVLLATDELERWRALVVMIQDVACRAAECCAEAKAGAVIDYGALTILGCDDPFQELNNEPGAPMGWDDHPVVGDGMSVSTNPMNMGRVTVSEGWHRIYSLVTYTSVTADTSIAVSILGGGATLMGEGCHGVIRAANGHNIASSSIETWLEAADGDQIQVVTARNGAVGGVSPVAGKSILVIERRPYGPGGAG